MQLANSTLGFVLTLVSSESVTWELLPERRGLCTGLARGRNLPVAVHVWAASRCAERAIRKRSASSSWRSTLDCVGVVAMEEVVERERVVAFELLAFEVVVFGRYMVAAVVGLSRRRERC